MKINENRRSTNIYEGKDSGASMLHCPPTASRTAAGGASSPLIGIASSAFLSILDYPTTVFERLKPLSDGSNVNGLE